MKVDIKVITKASRNEIIKQSDGFFRVRMTTAPERGKANKKLIDMLAKEFNVPKSRITIVKGETSRNKILEIKK